VGVGVGLAVDVDMDVDDVDDVVVITMPVVDVVVGEDVVVVDDTIIVVDGLIPAFIASMTRLRLVVNTPMAVCFVRPELPSAALSAHAM